MDDVRPASALDRRSVIDTVASAFSADPAWSFLCGEDYDRLAPRFAGALFDVRVDTGHVWVTDALTAVAMWDPPGDTASSAVSERVWSDYRSFAGPSTWRRLSAYQDALDAVRPPTPFWYLSVLATRPDHQGRGLATAVMAPVLAVADQNGFTCCLETSTAGNRAFYGRRGFTEVTAVHIASGPPTWWLRRT